MTVSLRLSADLGPRLRGTVDELVRDRIASRLFAKDPSLWGAEAVAEAEIRLGWTDLHDRLETITSQLDDLLVSVRRNNWTRVLLCGMGGSSLAPVVISRAAGVRVDVLDSSHPQMVATAMDDLTETLVMVASKSGGTVETDSHLQLALAVCAEQGLDVVEHLVVITDPESPLEAYADEVGIRVVQADPQVGGRYSALSAFGLAPSAAAGADVDRLLDEAARVAPLLAEDSPANPALRLGAMLGLGERTGVNVVALHDSPMPGLADWTEQLIAESTGKRGRGLLPVSVPEGRYPALGNVMAVQLGSVGSGKISSWTAVVEASLGAQFLLWEAATAVAGHLIGVNPFDQPDVERSKAATRRLLERGSGVAAESAGPFDLEVATASDAELTDAFADVVAAMGPNSYLSLQLYLDRNRVEGTERLSASLARELGRPVTVGWGPRFLHSTGQFHKGGPGNGVYLQVVTDFEDDIEVPQRGFTFGELIHSQSAGDAEVLRETGQSVFTWRVSDEAADVERLMNVLWS